jgi:hypothetical protein
MPPGRSYLGGIAFSEIQLEINTPIGRQAAVNDNRESSCRVPPAFPHLARSVPRPTPDIHPNPSVCIYQRAAM